MTERNQTPDEERVLLLTNSNVTLRYYCFTVNSATGLYYCTWFNFLLCRKLNFMQVRTKYMSGHGARSVKFLTIFSHCLQLSRLERKSTFNQRAVSCWPSRRRHQRLTKSWKGDGGALRGETMVLLLELLEIWYQHTLWSFICLQTAASLLRAWSGATDDVMRSVRMSNCAEHSVSDTLCLRVLKWRPFCCSSFLEAFTLF